MRKAAGRKSAELDFGAELAQQRERLVPRAVAGDQAEQRGAPATADQLADQMKSTDALTADERDRSGVRHKDRVTRLLGGIDRVYGSAVTRIALMAP
jgi:hypothetical protein